METEKREKYNTYMRAYMKRYREKKKVKLPQTEPETTRIDTV